MRTSLISLTLLLLALVAPSAANADAGFAPSPDPSRIVLNPAADPSTEQLVTWRTDALTLSGSVEYQPVAGGSPITIDAEAGLPVNFIDWTYSSLHHTARLTGLKPDTDYRYRVGKGDHWSDWFTFKTAAAAGTPWTLMYFGDAQNNLDVAWKPVVQRAFSHFPQAKVALHAGDLINRSSNDDEWGNWFAGVEGPAQSINQFVVTGNHEKSGDATGSQFREHFATPGNGPVLADSTVYYADYQGVRMIAVDGNGTALFDQIEFLERALETNPYPWSIVSFHQPIFAGADGRDGGVNRHFLLPVLKKHNVDLVLQGHDHVYARGVLEEDLDPTNGRSKGPVYTVTVAGPKYYDLAPSEDNDWNRNGAVRQVSHAQTSTYQPITFDGNTLTYRSFIAAKGSASTATGQPGQLLDAFTITKLPGGGKVVAEGEVPPDLNPDPDPETPKARPNVKVNKITRDKKNGTAKVTLTSNMAGKLKLTGKGIRSVARNLKAKKKVTVPVRTNNAKTKVLRRKGKFTVKVKINVRASNGKSRDLARMITLVSKRR